MTVDHADWLDFAGSLDSESVDLLYADPPFNTGQTQQGTNRSISSPVGDGGSAERNEAEGVSSCVVATGSPKTPSDPACGGPTSPVGDGGGEPPPSYPDSFHSTSAWVGWLRARLKATLPALKPTASILLHVDWRTSHHARLLLDEILGADNFVNHLVWGYGLGGSSPRRFARKHDDILFYAVDAGRYYFEPPMVPATSNRMKGELKKATDVLDIPAINNMACERTGYPTQKPVALLRLLVEACCPSGGLVLDPCCGSGTSLVAAVGTGRDAIGCDLNPDAVEVSRSRLRCLVDD